MPQPQEGAALADLVVAQAGAQPSVSMLDTEAHAMWVLWWHRIVPYRAYVKGFKIAPTHFINQDLARLWLDK